MPGMKTTDLFIFFWARVFAHKGSAAGFLGGREFHKLHPGMIRIVEVELHFAIAADLGLGAVGPFAFVFQPDRSYRSAQTRHR
jgi:hypothetical protein